MVGLLNKSGKYTIDRFEKNLVVLLLREDESIEILLDKVNLPDVKEGDIVQVDFDKDGKMKSHTVLFEETNKAKQQAKELLNKLIDKS